MQARFPLPVVLRAVAVLTVVLAVASPLSAQQSAPVLVTQAVDNAVRTSLPGNVHPLARAEFDRGEAPTDLPLKRMLLVLKRSPEQETALRKLLDDQQDKASSAYHKWLTPERFGQEFGLADADIQAVTGWLQSQMFQDVVVSKGRTTIEFSGTAAQVQASFHTPIHRFVVSGEEHWANASDPQIPSALAPAVAGVHTLHNFYKKSQIAHLQQVPATFTKVPAPQVTFQNPTVHALGPQDYATIYNINPTYNAGISGAGITIAVVGRSNFGIQDVIDFRNAFGLPFNIPQIISNGDSPGDLGGGEEAEAILDTTWSGAVAPNATVDFVVSASTNTTDGVDLSELYIVDNNLADIMTESFSSCEAFFTSAEAAAVKALAEQAAAQGITYLVSTGDTGAEGCDNLSEQVATGPISVNMLASTPFNTAVGGTIFNEGNQSSKYWGSAPPLAETALSYIPEDVWNESCVAAQCGSQNANIAAGGGGASTFFNKPSWQSGVAGIPNDGARDLPDVSLTAALHDPYLLCIQSSCEQGFIFFVAGTSASAPSFAGIMALVDQKMGSRQGQANYVLYRLAATETLSKCNGSNTQGLPASNCIFNDVTVGNNAVPGETGYGTPNAKYQSTVGYDLATGLGSVNVANLVNNWNSVTFSPTTTTLGLNPTTITHGAPVTVNIGVAPNSGTGVPTGDVSLRNADLFLSGLDGIFFPLSGGVVSSVTNDLAGGTYHVVAHYAGDGTFAPSDSIPVAVTVAQEGSKTALSIFALDAQGNVFPFVSEPYGSPAYLRADVASQSGHGTATGGVIFTENGVNFLANSYNLNSEGNAATAQGVFTIPAGPHSIVANYNGDVSLTASNSPPVSITVTPGPTTTTVVSSASNVAEGGIVTLTATLNTTSFGRRPGGTVTFLSGGVPISNAGNPVGVGGIDGSGNIQTGVFTTAQGFASLVTTLPVGQDSITAQYSSDSNYAGSTSAAIIVNVQADFDFSASGSALTVTRGGSGSLTFTITGHPGYNGTVTFSGTSCTGLPAESSCSFNPTSVTGSGSTTLTIHTTAPHNARLEPLDPWTTGSGGILAGILLLGSVSKRRIRGRLLTFLVLAGLITLMACGGGGGGSHSDPGTPPGTYTVKVTAATGALTHSINLTLTVQ